MDNNIIHNSNGSSVDNELWDKIKNGTDILIITGFSSIEFFSTKINTINFKKTNNIRFLIGNEFNEIEDKSKNTIEERALRYWQNKEFSYKNIQNIKKLYDLIIEEKIKIKIDKKQHSKIYLNEYYGTVGSSNFSYSGFKYQKETNNIIEVKNKDYESLKDIAEQYWEEGLDYSIEFAELLEKILYLEDTDWRNAFTLIYNEFFEGKWYNDKEQKIELWETQKEYLAKSIILLEMYSGIILADPTGSGKTRAVASTLKHLENKYNKLGLLNKNTILIVCPAVVVDEWEKTLNDVGLLGYKVISNASSELEEEIKKYKVLVFDEAHSYNNKDSKRSKSILLNEADYKIFMTATPINKKIQDYYGLLIQFGPDNLSDDTYRKLNDFFESEDANKHVDDLYEKVKLEIKEALSKFTIRRTKNKLNEIAINNNQDTYPIKKSKYYELELDEKDTWIIEKIKNEISYVKGYFYSSKSRQCNKKTMGLAKHNLIYNLRSSKIAALEHIYGTKKALELENIIDKSILNNSISEKEGVLNKLESIYREAPSLSKNSIKKEIKIYENIGKLIKDLSKKFTDEKLKLTYNEIKGKDEFNILFFDKSPITNIYFYHKLIKSFPSFTIKYTTGNTSKNKEEIKELFSPNNTKTQKAIAFCSDVFSEGVNLQKADTIVFTDLPYTPKVIEQRIGRIDRMNSKHEIVNVVWIKYPRCLLLKNDIEFKKRYNNVAQILGSNYELPDFFNNYKNEKNILKIEDFPESAINDNDLNRIEGNDDIIIDNNSIEDNFDKEKLAFDDAFGDYELLKKFIKKENNNLSKIGNEGSIYSFIESDSEWCLLYLIDKNTGYPNILFIDIDNETAENNIIEIVKELSKRLPNIKNTISDFLNEDLMLKKIEYSIMHAKKPEVKSLSGEQKNSLLMLEKYIIDNKHNYPENYKKYKSISNKKEVAKIWHSKIKSVYVDYLKNDLINKKLPKISLIREALRINGYFDNKNISEVLKEVKTETNDFKIRICLLSFKSKK